MRVGILSTIALSSVAVLLTSCAPLLAANPRFATDDGAGPQGAPTTTAEADGPPALEAPKSDLSWQDCTSRVFADAAVPALPGVTLDCATYEADLDPIKGANGSIPIGVVRATSVDTPEDAGPLVMTTGTDLPSSSQLPVWLSRAGADILKTNPIVAVDRRGTGLSDPIDCRDLFDRQEMIDQAQFEPGDDPVANLSAIVQTATTTCTDTIAPGDSAYDNAHAAEDIERLRSTWDVPTIALMGIGNGAQVALAYAGSHPDKVARLVLDSPLPLAIGAEAATEQKVKGQQAALDAFAAQCAATNCALGPDPKGAVDALLTAARNGDGPNGASEAAVADAIITALAFPRGDRVSATNALAGAIAAARAGDTNAMTNLITQAETIRQTDGQFVNSCSDALNRPTPDRVRELVVAWDRLYPQFGTVGALRMVNCLSWPSGTAPQDPENLNVPVMLLGVQNDPIVGNEGVAAVAATIINAGSNSKRVIWQGIGHGASIYTACALPPVIGYLESGKLPETDTFCPA
ncbi:alpha/beta fold hydrolase [Mycobacterium frederiksbergense]|uniref:Alpha/beta hydrolase n=1 Tax=Mycolicibacterium frederiksbergense TaxID=117567 RepID=A0A6H0SC57_9MYCO|nr:alpha/beta hydrolase [Mycolicibacterium frederiksbergense]MCV7047853.1 alpha/beta fold hydrolase [Mycolicibacterium frederiksbergense]QIV84948.1 alpha/beta hydrolase [Mycolicibacterium frederiksbergense]